MLSPEENEHIQAARKQLCQARAARMPPTTDGKVITARNAIMVQGLVDAYHTLGETHYLDLALQNATFIKHRLMQGDRLWHSYPWAARSCRLLSRLRLGSTRLYQSITGYLLRNIGFTKPKL